MSPIGEHARLVARELAAGGVRDVVVSPGSRSTPFVHAVHEEPRLAVHLVVDERAAAFFALGRAKATGAPVALLCTSGSAAAHYYPALLEAEASFVPLVVLSADRPVELQRCGASQTLDQVGLFGGHVRLFADVPPPDGREESFGAVRRTVAQIVLASRHPTPGPVHLNLRADKPLEPGPPRDDQERAAEEAARTVGEPKAVRVAVPRSAPDPDALDALAARLRAARRPIVVAGPRALVTSPHGARVHELCARSGAVLLAEATSQLRFTGAAPPGVVRLDGFDAVLRCARGRRALRPDLVVELGATPTSKGWELFLSEERRVERWLVAQHGWPDPHGTASGLILGDESLAIDRLLERLGDTGRGLDVADEMRSVEARVRAVIESMLASEDSLGEGGVARTVVAACPERGLLAVGNSLPVRLVDTWAHGELARVSVLSQRGTSGIDGLVAGAAGAASASARPTVLYLGDVSLLHDLGGLAAARALPVPLVVVVANNDGGRIFEQLPVATAPALAPCLELFTTPHGLSFEHAASLFGHRYARVDRASDLRRAIATGLASTGCTVVEAVVPHDAAAREARELAARVERALEEVWP